jgi:DNA-binding NtrC family response regulator
MSVISAEQILVISPDADHHEKIKAIAQRFGLGSICCRKFVEARIFMGSDNIKVVFCNDALPDVDFRAVIAAVKTTPVVVLSRFAEWDYYLTALRDGAFDYIACPPDSAETERILRAAICSRRQNRQDQTNAGSKAATVVAS